jgi:GNAT superfamily N-acetyltransferase
MDSIEVRPAESGELPAVAGLRWRWLEESGASPVTTRDGYIRHLTAWAADNASSHRCLVAVRDGTVIGMAWLAVTSRVPAANVLERATGDVQSVYVLPEERNAGIGDRLIEAVLEIARRLGLERVTVHSSDRAVSAYARRGFEVSPCLLQSTTK